MDLTLNFGLKQRHQPIKSGLVALGLGDGVEHLHESTGHHAAQLGVAGLYAHAAATRKESHSASAFNRPPVNASIWSCLKMGTFPQLETVPCVMPNASLSATCVPNSEMASSFVMPKYLPIDTCLSIDWQIEKGTQGFCCRCPILR